MPGLIKALWVSSTALIYVVSLREQMSYRLPGALARSSTGLVSALSQWPIARMGLKMLLNLGEHVAAESGLTVAIH
jgi:hypothetical protein